MIWRIESIHRIMLLMFVVALMPASVLHSQFYSTGQDPYGMKWEELQTRNFRILYDEGFRSEAVRLVRLMESYRQPTSSSLAVDPKPITIIVHNHSVISNAMVPMAPRRVEFYPLSPQDGLAQEWFRQLAIHEYRHVGQFGVIDQGFTKGLSYVFGEQALAAVMGVMVPFWYIEGDATILETALSESGRGRQPDFIMPLRTQLLEQGKYSYEKAMFRSYRDYVPDRYILGYHLVGASRQYYGAEIWQKAIENTAHRPWMIMPFSLSLRKQTGLGVGRLYKAMMDSLQNEWANDTLGITFSPYYEYPHRDSKVYTDYLHPFPVEGGGIICLRKRLDDIPRFVLIDSVGNEDILYTPGYIMEESISFRDGILAWTEYHDDIRWENRSYSEVWVYDLKNNQAKRITKSTRYFSPSISKYGRRIAVSYTSPTNNQELHIIDGRTGRIIAKFPHPSNRQIVSPSWAFNDSLILFISSGPNGRGIQSLNPALGTFSIILPESPNELRQPFGVDAGVFFTQGMGGVRNLYVMDMEWKYIWRLTSSRYGITDPYFDPETKIVWYSEYTYEGYRPVWEPIEYLAQSEMSSPNAFSLELADSLSISEGGPRIMEQDSFHYEIKPYRRLAHTLKPHSWAPLSIRASSQSATPGLSVISQNLLSTTFIEAGYSLDLNERTGNWYVDASLKSFYPVFDLNYSWGIRNSKYVTAQHDTLPFSWKESIVRAGVYLPLKFHKGKWLRWVQPSIRYSRITASPYDARVDFKLDPWSSLYLFGDQPYHSTPEFIATGAVNSFDYGLFLVNQRRSGLRDFRPVWRQSVDLRFRHSPLGEKTLGWIAGVNSAFYFPGALKNHSVRLALSGQIRESGNSLYGYGGLIPVPRGIHGLFQDTLLYGSISYAFPILYPDFSLGPLVYVKRVKADIYLDFASGNSNLNWSHYRSIGVDLTADAHFLRFLAPATAGIRSVYVPVSNTWTFELLFQLNFDDI